MPLQSLWNLFFSIARVHLQLDTPSTKSAIRFHLPPDKGRVARACHPSLNVFLNPQNARRNASRFFKHCPANGTRISLKNQKNGSQTVPKSMKIWTSRASGPSLSSCASRGQPMGGLFEKMLFPERYNISIYEVFEVIICENISIY